MFSFKMAGLCFVLFFGCVSFFGGNAFSGFGFDSLFEA